MSHTIVGPFRKAALDPSITILQLFELNATQSPAHTFFTFELNQTLQRLTWKQVHNAIEYSARLAINSSLGADLSDGSRPVVGILASTDAITHFTWAFGLLRAEYPTFHISTRNSAAAVAHLLFETRCNHVYVSQDSALQDVSSGATAILASRGHSVTIHKMPSYADIYSKSDVKNVLIPSLSRIQLDTPAFILHSSGSTSYPKPIYVSHRIFMHWVRHPLFAEGDLNCETMAIHALPMFHGMALLMTSWASSTGMIVSCFPPVSPPVLATPDNVLQSMISTESTLLFCVPSFLEHWSESPQSISRLASLKAVAFAGAPLSNATGDLLAHKRVPMVHMYGTTETGCGTIFLPKTPQYEDWRYLSFSPQLKFQFIPCEDDSLYELVFLEGPDSLPCVFNTVVDGHRGYATNDTFVQHPTNLALWKLHGRKDDQLVLSTGEKTNPGPIETILCRDPMISHAIMFGQGREQNGVIIQPREDYVIDTSDIMAIASFRSKIWPSIIKANAIAPSHSRLYKEMVIVTSVSKPFDLTSKGTPRRGVVLKSYEKEIEEAYDAIQQSPQCDIAPPQSWTSEDTRKFIRNIVSEALGRELADDADLFENGFDSIQATWLQALVVNAMRMRQSTTMPLREISLNLVYENPSVSALANHITCLAVSPSTSLLPNSQESTRLMHSLVEEQSRDFLRHLPSPSLQKDTTGDVVLVTGTTGALGSHLLAQLITKSDISRIYAINRPARSNVTLHERQRQLFEDRGLDASLLTASKLVLLEAITSLPLLGLEKPRFDEIRSSVTHIIHNAWRVDFRTSLLSFKTCIQGTRCLIDLALASPLPLPPAFIFTSSVGVLRNWSLPGLIPEAPVPAETAVGYGYSESKWVAEKLLEVASQETNLRSTIVRLDQLSGAPNGAWNQTDSIPSIIRSGQVLGCLPDRTEDIAWLPIHAVARWLIEIRGSRTPYLHFSNPNPIPWHQIFRFISTELNVELVPFPEWLSRLSGSSTLSTLGFRDNPALLLLPFFQTLRETPKLDVSQTQKHLNALTGSALEGALSHEDVKKWIRYWKEKGFLN